MATLADSPLNCEAGAEVARASTRIDSNQPRSASFRTSISMRLASSRSPAREEICASTAFGEMWCSPVNETSLMSGVAATIADDVFAFAGEVSSGGCADAAPERHSIPNDPERSQRTIISPCTRRMREQMTGSSAGLSRLGGAVPFAPRKQQARRHKSRGEPAGRSYSVAELRICPVAGSRNSL